MPYGIHPAQFAHAGVQQPQQFQFAVESHSRAGPVESFEELQAGKPIRMRSLISAKDAGLVIGKSGQHIAEVREKSGSRLTVSGQIPGAIDRIVTVTGSVDSNAHAFYLIALKLASSNSHNNASNNDSSGTTDPHSRTITMRLLVPQSRIGIIIGRQGSKIRELQEATGCKVYAQGDQLPNSNERAVTLTGTPVTLQNVISRIGYHIGDIPSNTILYTPSAPGTFPVQQMPYAAMISQTMGSTSGQTSGDQRSIKVGDPQPGVNRRVVTLTGSPECIAIAQQMLQARVDAETKKLEAQRGVM
eukprot:jgi/Hompol1/300/HPOL_001347-RA